MPIVLVSPSILEPWVLEEDDRMEEEDGGEEYDDESRKQQRTIFTKAASITSRSTLSSLTESGSTSIVSARSLFSAIAEYSREINDYIFGYFIMLERQYTFYPKINFFLRSFSRPQRIFTTADISGS